MRELIEAAFDVVLSWETPQLADAVRRLSGTLGELPCKQCGAGVEFFFFRHGETVPDGVWCHVGDTSDGYLYCGVIEDDDAREGDTAAEPDVEQWLADHLADFRAEGRGHGPEPH